MFLLFSITKRIFESNHNISELSNCLQPWWGWWWWFIYKATFGTIELLIKVSGVDYRLNLNYIQNPILNPIPILKLIHVRNRKTNFHFRRKKRARGMEISCSFYGPLSKTINITCLIELAVILRAIRPVSVYYIRKFVCRIYILYLP